MKKDRLGKVTIVLTDKKDVGVQIDVAMDPPIEFQSAKGARKWGYRIMNFIAENAESIKCLEHEIEKLKNRKP